MQENEIKRLREAGLRAYREKLAKGEVKRLTPIERARANPQSMRKAIDAKCYDCCGRDNWVRRTKYCHIFDCPFWHIRKGGKGVTKQECSEYNK